MSVAVTDGIRVEVTPFYVSERSKPERDYFFFAYRVVISNEGDSPARLVSRHWLISDGRGRTEEVQGPGVVGETPRLEPGQRHEYTSFCPLNSPQGSMRGSYQMVRDDGTRFDARIEVFSLMATHLLN